MTWQDSLRQLDARLAKGEIGAAEYRKARDEILAEASSGSPNPGRGAREDLWAAANPATNGASGTAAADTAAAADDASAAETTLVVTVDATAQAAPEPEANTSVVTKEDETTQVVSADQIPPAPPVQQGPQGPLPPMPVGPPGVRPTPYRAAPIQGQEVFTQNNSGGGSTALRFLVPLLVLALVGGGVWWFVLRGDEGGGDTAGPPPQTTTEQQPATTGTDEIDGKMPELPGRANENNGTMSLDKARELKLFTKPYGAMLADNGSSEVVYRGSVRPGYGYLVVASPIPPANGADGVAVLAREHLQRAGFTPAQEVSPDDPPVITRQDDQFRTFIAVYNSGDVWVQLNVSTQPDGNEQQLRDEFQKILTELTERLPAD
ncbi:hypothetical protein BLA60_32360 [Actinophytocola xinjiangensis]|uniref:SHOCT domain-containing protein n=1 Tax=Actinophytocola xinjiangensis TaxID=485602 RepID=A0A7Z0WH01_9PSEU|nr:SHOCT domain-containing protein [Actinophytocola xinjiangensis]OLF06332.1 hypothetical protein BLA60_32360 [Actinophytocola xinjiangensis]